MLQAKETNDYQHVTHTIRRRRKKTTEANAFGACVAHSGSNLHINLLVDPCNVFNDAFDLMRVQTKTESSTAA